MKKEPQEKTELEFEPTKEVVVAAPPIAAPPAVAPPTPFATSF